MNKYCKTTAITLGWNRREDGNLKSNRMFTLLDKLLLLKSSSQVLVPLFLPGPWTKGLEPETPPSSPFPHLPCTQHQQVVWALPPTAALKHLPLLLAKVTPCKSPGMLLSVMSVASYLASQLLTLCM